MKKEKLKIRNRLIVIILALSFGACDLFAISGGHGIVLKGRNVNNVFQDKGAKELAIAAANGKVEEICRLIKSGASVNYQSKEGITPLLWAFWGNNRIGFEELLKNGANPNLMVGPDPMMRFFTEPIVIEESNDFEYKYDDAIFLELALKYGGNPNAVDSVQRTMLMIACSPGTVRRAELLIKYGADIEKRTPLREETALLYAAVSNQFEKVYYLLQKGADYTVKSKFGYDLVHIIEEQPFGISSDPGTKGRNKTIHFLRDKGYKFVPYEENPQNKR